VNPQPTVTLADVAAAAGVSLATASRVVNGSTRTVGAALRGKVLAAAAELGYTANANAQAMASGRSKTVGLIVHDIADPYFSTIAAGAAGTVDPHGILVLGNTWGRPDYELEFLTTMRAQRARAVLLVGSRSTDLVHTRLLAAEVAGFTASGGRVAAVGQDLLGADTVVPENRAAAAGLARALTGQGHRSFAVLAGPPGLLAARDRLEGFRDAVSGEVEVFEGPFTRDGGYAAAVRLLDSGEPLPDCLFAVNDVMAIGAMAALRDRGLEAPRDIGVAGFDDIPTLRDVAPSLTTVRLPLEAMGRRAAELVLDDGVRDAPRVERVPGEVVLRESTARS
jgi:LacI family transcriptional regulator